MAGGAIIFFTYIGFDSVSTAAEESSESRRRTLPFGIIVSLIVCTILYIGVADGAFRHDELLHIWQWHGEASDAPVTYALKQLGANQLFQAVIVLAPLWA